MKDDDEVCLCFHVTLEKIEAYLRREDPPVASLISECLGAGTGCGWCVPHLEKLHALYQQGQPLNIEHSPIDYAKGRETYREERRASRNKSQAPQGTDDVQ